MKLIFKILFTLALSICTLLISGCGEKTPEEIAKDNKLKIDLAIKKSQVLLLEEKSAQAVDLLEKTYQECGENALLCEILAYAYMQSQNFANAAIFFERASDLKGGNADLLMNAAKAYQQANSLDSALKAYQKYLELNPTDVFAFKSIAKIYENQDRIQDALRTYLDALKIANRNPNSQEATQIGTLFLKFGNAPQAKMWLEAAFAATSDNNIEVRKEVLNSLIAVYLLQKDMPSLLSTVNDLDKLDATLVDKNYPNLRAQIQDYNNKLKEAQDEIEKLKDLEKQKEQEQTKLLEEKAKEDEAKNVEELVQEPKETTPSTEDEIQEKSEEKLEEKVQEKPAEEQLLDQEVLIEDIQDVEEVPQEKVQTFTQQSEKMLDEGNYKQAQKFAHKAILEDEESSQAWIALAKAYEADGKYNDAYMVSMEALKRNPDDLDATIFYIKNASQVKNNEEFLNILYTAHKKFPYNSEIMLGLAKTYKLLNDTRNAKYFYNRFLNEASKEHPNYEEAQEEFKELMDKR